MNRMIVAFALVAGLATLRVDALAGGRHSDPSAPASASQPIATSHTLTLEGAKQVLAAAMAKARERGAGGSLAVVDDGGIYR